MTPAELKKRRKYLGGSEIAAVLGLSPFQTAAGLWDEKMGLVEPKPTSDAMWVGIYLEDGIAKLWHHHAMKKRGATDKSVVRLASAKVSDAPERSSKTPPTSGPTT